MTWDALFCSASDYGNLEILLGYVATTIPLCNFDAAQTDDWNLITEKVLGFAPQKMFDYF